ncbi:DnaJ-domain-containing protein [Hesseltinella vesiculosa]|uniref:DnaJ-domain-containing protein n=1 Tax=Hesseltinella vesiculosa TaxID=101127 RepID=A0A1X2GH07_9FUNG|nr:DnaJ-domain-containing protein [Hesseltinella vesiculosa]
MIGSSSTPSTHSYTLPKEDPIGDILSASDYFKVLGVDKKANSDDIRRAYIKKSRFCHPDKAPNDPRATLCFQRLTEAHETLAHPRTRLHYEIIMDNDQSQTLLNCPMDEATAQEVFERVVHQLYTEMVDGEFQTMRVILGAVNDAYPSLQVSDELMNHTEDVLLKIRDLMFSTKKYYQVIEDELLQLYELQQEMRLLGIFDFKQRLRLSLAISRSLLMLPILINNATKKNKDVGILGTYLENILQFVVNHL